MRQNTTWAVVKYCVPVASSTNAHSDLHSTLIDWVPSNALQSLLVRIGNFSEAFYPTHLP